MTLECARIHGHDLWYRKEGTGPLLLLIHGMVGSAATWRYVIPALAERFTVVAPDLIGHGASAKPRDDYSVGAYATALRDLLAALHLGQGTLIGQSFGGGVAMQMAYQYPELCERLVLVGSGGLGIEVNALLRALSVPGAEFVLPLGCTPTLRDLSAKVVGLFGRLGFHPGPALVEIGRSYASLVDADARRSFLLTLRSVIDHVGQRVSARNRLYLTAEIPTLIIWGTHDPIIPVHHAHDTHAAMPHSRLVLFERAGHYPHCEDPARFVRVLLDFIADTPPAVHTPAAWRERIRRGHED